MYQQLWIPPPLPCFWVGAAVAECFCVCLDFILKSLCCNWARYSVPSLSPPLVGGTPLLLTVVQSPSRVQLFVTPWTAARQASWSSTVSRSVPKLKRVKPVMASNRLTLCRPFSSCTQSFPAPGSFPISWLFSSGGQGIRASASVLYSFLTQVLNPGLSRCRQILYHLSQPEKAHLLVALCFLAWPREAGAGCALSLSSRSCCVPWFVGMVFSVSLTLPLV